MIRVVTKEEDALENVRLVIQRFEEANLNLLSIAFSRTQPVRRKKLK